MIIEIYKIFKGLWSVSRIYFEYFHFLFDFYTFLIICFVGQTECSVSFYYDGYDYDEDDHDYDYDYY